FTCKWQQDVRRQVDEECRGAGAGKRRLIARSRSNLALTLKILERCIRACRIFSVSIWPKLHILNLVARFQTVDIDRIASASVQGHLTAYLECLVLLDRATYRARPADLLAIRNTFDEWTKSLCDDSKDLRRRL